MKTALAVFAAHFLMLALERGASAISKRHRDKLDQRLKAEAATLKEINTGTSLKQELGSIGDDVAQLSKELGLSDEENHIFHLMKEPLFQSDLATWLMAWSPDGKQKAEEALSEQMTVALRRGGAHPDRAQALRSGYFERVEEVLFRKHPDLAIWRLSLALNAALRRLYELETSLRDEEEKTREEVRRQHEETRRLVSRISTEVTELSFDQISEEQREAALCRYRELMLESCHIIDISNLPEDRHTATREISLSKLYVPLRVRVQSSREGEITESMLQEMDKHREALRVLAAGGSSRHPDREEPEERTTIGERIAESGKIVLLGDPGAGKTTLLRWIATAYLLRLKNDPAFKDLPDVSCLPNGDWLPVLIRCRDLDKSKKTGAIDDVLSDTFRRAQMSKSKSSALLAVIRKRLADGEAILLIDGLDEIADTSTRTSFCQQVESIHIAFPKAPILVTSRIVGYKEMKRRIGRGFEHATLCDLTSEDKDRFARNWCELTEPPERRDSARAELIKAIHGSDRIERLAGNPMLLTTLALVKRRVGRLPNRRAELYSEAVKVLLDWRAEVDEPIDPREAIPQLEYIAFEMSRRGTQRLRKDEVLDLLEGFRDGYPKVRPVHKHTPEEFLRMVEGRTGLLMESGEKMHKGELVPVYEFRHLTFQEYLAARALVDGKFPGWDSKRRLADHLAPLVTQSLQSQEDDSPEAYAIAENWREVFRLCVACAGDADADDAILAVLIPSEDEDPKETARPRAIMAALCLVDEPQVSEEAAIQILTSLLLGVTTFDQNGETALCSAVLGLAASEWVKQARDALLQRFRQPDFHSRYTAGILCGLVSNAIRREAMVRFGKWLEDLHAQLRSGDPLQAVQAALAIAASAKDEKLGSFAGMFEEGLLAMLNRDEPSSLAAAMAFRSLGDRRAVGPLITLLRGGSPHVRIAAAVALGEMKDSCAVESLLNLIVDEVPDVSRAAARALGELKDARAVEPLLRLMTDERPYVLRAAAWVLGELGEASTVEPLLDLLVNESPITRLSAAWALRWCKDDRALPTLLALLDDTSLDVRIGAVEILGAFQDPCAVSPLINLLMSESPEMKASIAYALGRIGDHRAREPLTSLLEDDNRAVRRAAASALRHPEFVLFY